jgi:hypothetical protein
MVNGAAMKLPIELEATTHTELEQRIGEATAAAAVAVSGAIMTFAADEQLPLALKAFGAETLTQVALFGGFSQPVRLCLTTNGAILDHDLFHDNSAPRARLPHRDYGVPRPPAAAAAQRWHALNFANAAQPHAARPVE